MKKAAVPSILVAVVLLAVAVIAEAQQPGKVPRIGYLSRRGEPTAANPDPNADAFRRALRDLGYIEGKNILIEFRYAEGKTDRLKDLVAELMQLKVDVFISGTIQGVRAAKHATQSIPIVMAITGDPVADRLVNSLARPGGNITGLTRLTQDLSGKRLELLKEVVPGIARVGLLSDASGSRGLEDYEAAARALKIQLQLLEVSGPNPELEGAFQAAAKGRATALVTVYSAVFVRYAKRIADLAIKNRLPSVFEGGEFVDSGGLLSYSANDADNFRRAATYVDKILKELSLPIFRSNSR